MRVCGYNIHATIITLGSSCIKSKLIQIIYNVCLKLNTIITISWIKHPTYTYKLTPL